MLQKVSNFLWLLFNLCIYFHMSVIFVQFCTGYDQLVQERAVVRFMNQKYISNVQVFTARRRRSEPYRTNLTATIHHPWGNNVTFIATYMAHGNTIDLTTRTCDAIHKPWMLDFVKLYSNLTQCPVLPGTYRYFNIELPPRNFPFPLPMLKKGDTIKVTAGFFMTASKEKMLDMFCILRVK